MNDTNSKNPLPVQNEAASKTVIKKQGLLKSSMLVSAMTMLSRVLGLVRDTVLAAVLGGVASGGESGAFYVAFKVPNFLRRLFAEGAFSQAFVPVLSEYQQKYTHEEVKNLIDRVCGVLSAVLLLVVVLVMLAAPWATFVIAPGFVDEPEKFALTQSLLRICFPYLLFISLAGFLGAILNANNRFAVAAFTPVWLNVCMITAGLYFTKFIDSVAYALAYGVLLAGVVQLLFLLPFVYKIGFLPKPKFDLAYPGVRKIFQLMLPAMFGVSVGQINLVVDTILASFLPDGSIAWLYFSQRLAELPLGIFAIAIGTVILPNLSRQFSGKNIASFAPTLDWGVRIVLMTSIPAVIALWLLATPILVSFFLYGKTTLVDIQMSSYSLIAYSMGIIFFMLVKVLVPGFYARQDMKTPVRIAVICMVANIGLNLVLVFPLHSYYRLGHMGLALSTSISAALNVFLLWYHLKKQGVYKAQPVFWRQFVYFVIAALVMASVLLQLTGNLQDWLELRPWWRIARLLGICTLGAASYFAVLWLFGLRVKDFRQSL